MALPGWKHRPRYETIEEAICAYHIGSLQEKDDEVIFLAVSSAIGRCRTRYTTGEEGQDNQPADELSGMETIGHHAAGINSRQWSSSPTRLDLSWDIA